MGKSDTVPFRIQARNYDIAVGQLIDGKDGSRLKVTSIQSIKFLSMADVEIIGRAKVVRVPDSKGRG